MPTKTVAAVLRERGASPTLEEVELRDPQAGEVLVRMVAAGVCHTDVAYVDGEVAGWVNASRRCEYSLFRRNDDEDATTVGVSCFAIAPPYRGHGIAKRLLDRVVADAGERDASWIEAYPFNEGRESDNLDFRGPRSIYDARGFTEVKVRHRDTVVRRPVTS